MAVERQKMTIKKRLTKIVKREEWIYLRELVFVGVLVALVMAGLGHIAEMYPNEQGAGPVHTVAERPQQEASPSSVDVSEPVSAEPRPDGDIAIIERPEDEPTQHLAKPLVNSALDGLDPIARPEYFDEFDAIGTFGDLVAHLPNSRNYEPLRTTPSTKSHIVVDKIGHTITFFSNGEFSRQYGVAVGKNPGNKSKEGDMRTPEGTFTILQVHEASHWVHDFGDGKGVIEGAYGPLFIRLNTAPWRGIGIHGTHDPDSIGSDATEGCIRMNNSDLLELADLIEDETTVTILPN